MKTKAEYQSDTTPTKDVPYLNIYRTVYTYLAHLILVYEPQIWMVSWYTILTSYSVCFYEFDAYMGFCKGFLSPRLTQYRSNSTWPQVITWHACQNTKTRPRWWLFKYMHAVYFCFILSCRQRIVGEWIWWDSFTIILLVYFCGFWDIARVLGR